MKHLLYSLLFISSLSYSALLPDKDCVDDSVFFSSGTLIDVIVNVGKTPTTTQCNNYDGVVFFFCGKFYYFKGKARGGFKKIII